MRADRAEADLLFHVIFEVFHGVRKHGEGFFLIVLPLKEGLRSRRKMREVKGDSIMSVHFREFLNITLFMRMGVD